MSVYFKGLIFFIASFMASSVAHAITLDVEQAMDMSENHSFAARIAEKTEVQEAENKSAIFRGMFPNISASGNYLKYDENVNKSVGNETLASFGGAQPTVSVGALELNQPLTGLIYMYEGLKQAAAKTRAAARNKDQTRTNARYNGAQAYVNVEIALDLLDVAKTSLALAAQQLNDAEARFEVGRLTKADVLQLQYNLETAKSTLIEAQTTYYVSLATLGETVGILDGSPIEITREKISLVEIAMPDLTLPPLDLFLDKASTQRYDLMAAKENITSAEYGKRGAMATYIPTVNFVANYSRNFEADAITVPGNTSADPSTTYSKNDLQDNFYYGIEFSWNLLDWGVRQAQIGGAVAAVQSSEIALEQAQSNARLDVTQSYSTFRQQLQLLDSSLAAVAYSTDAYDQVKAQFDNGRAITTDLITALNNLTNAEATLANTRGQLDLAWFNLQRAAGQTISKNNLMEKTGDAK